MVVENLMSLMQLDGLWVRCLQKNLRGDQMSDVIFNGSSARKPAGQATVELILTHPRKS